MTATGNTHGSRTSRTRAMAALLGLAFSAAVGAQVAATGAGDARPRSSAAEMSANAKNMAREGLDFMRKAAESGQAEVESSKLALDKSKNASVQSFARHMVDEHTAVNAELAALASSKGIKLPDGPSLAQRTKLKLLSMADGPDFDRKFKETFGETAHRDAIRLFEEASRELRDPEIKAFATQKLPALRKHLEMAEALAVGERGVDAPRRPASTTR